MSENLQVRSEIIENTKKKLLMHYCEVLNTPEAAAVKTEQIILKALEGWDRAPKTFEARINKLARLGPESPKGDSKSRTQAEEKKLHEQISKLFSEKKYIGNLNILFNNYTADEKKMFLERLNFYYQEFDFNQSSDFAALFSLLADEIRLYKLHSLQAQDPTENYSKQLSEAHQRILTGQKALGITKDQRNSLRDTNEGSISQLSVDLEKKLKKREQDKIKENEKELLFTQEKENRDPEYKGIRVITSITDADLKILKEDS